MNNPKQNPKRKKYSPEFKDQALEHELKKMV